jgi:DNA polymerase IV
MITKPNATAQDLMRLMTSLVETLSNQNFLTHSLATSHSDDGSKWHGVSRLPNGLHRRLDLLFVPWKERGAALIYFTGNDIFNRSLRLLASKKGMGLNQRGLFKDTLRGPMRVKLTRGTCIASESEEEIFRILGVPWRPPELRNC